MRDFIPSAKQRSLGVWEIVVFTWHVLQEVLKDLGMCVEKVLARKKVIDYVKSLSGCKLDIAD